MAEKEYSEAIAENFDSDSEKSISSVNSSHVIVTTDKGKGKRKAVMVDEDKSKEKTPSEVAEKARENKVMRSAMNPLRGRSKNQKPLKIAPREPGYKPKCCIMRASNDPTLLAEKAAEEAKRKKSTQRKAKGKKPTEKVKEKKVMADAIEPLVGQSKKRKSDDKDAPPKPKYKCCRKNAS